MIHDRSKTKLVVPDDHLHVATILFHGDTATSSDLLQRDEKEEEEERKRERERERRQKGRAREGGKWKLRDPAMVLRPKPAKNQLFPRSVNNRELSSRTTAGE